MQNIQDLIEELANALAQAGKHEQAKGHLEALRVIAADDTGGGSGDPQDPPEGPGGHG